MAAVTKEELMLYCRVDDDTLGDLLVELAETAENYLETAGAVCTDGTAPRYRTAVKALTLHYLDNPTGAPVPVGLQNLINQLKFSKEES